MIGLVVHGLAAWTLYATWAGERNWLWWSLLAAWIAMGISGTAMLNAERFAKEKYVEDTGLQVDLKSLRLPVSAFGEYRRPAIIAFGLNVGFTLLTVAFSTAGLTFNGVAE